MANKSKAKGTRAETRVRKYLMEHGFTARRQALAGREDEGDLEVIAPGCERIRYIAEVKTGKQTIAPSRTQIEEWCEQAVTEAKNAGGYPVLIVVRYNRQLKDADVYVPMSKLPFGTMIREHWFLEDWVAQEDVYYKAFRPD